MLNAHILEDNVIEFDGMRDAVAGTYINDATMTGTLKTNRNVDVAGAVDMAISYVAASDGKYRGSMDSTVTLKPETTYFLHLTYISNNRNGYRRIPVRAKYHEE